MSGVVRWEEPPPHGNTGVPRSSHWQEVAQSLRARPGEWALVIEGAALGTVAAAVHRIKTGKQTACFRPGGAFDARSVKRTATTGDLYARYIGEPEQEITEEDPCVREL